MQVRPAGARLGIFDTEHITALEALDNALVAAASLSRLIGERDQVSTALPGSAVALLGEGTTLRTLEAQIEDSIRAREAAVRDEQATAETVLTEHSARRDGYVRTMPSPANPSALTATNKPRRSVMSMWAPTAPIRLPPASRR
jgi:hypothetical protein